MAAAHLSMRTTVASNFGLQVYFQPLVTPAPSPDQVNLRARQATSARGDTCGWVDGNPADPVKCNSGYICGTIDVSIVGCCHSTASAVACTDVITTCYDILGSPCDSSCQANLNNLICASPTPYCATYIYPSSSTGFGCAPYSSYVRTVALTPNTSNQGGPLFGSTSSNSTSSSTTSTAAPAAQSSLAPTSHSISSGAIAGIVIGSVAALALGLLALACLLQLRRQAAPQADPPPEVAAHQGHWNRGSSLAGGAVPGGLRSPSMAAKTSWTAGGANSAMVELDTRVQSPFRPDHQPMESYPVNKGASGPTGVISDIE